MVTAVHDLTLAGQFCDSVALVGGGRVVACGPPETTPSPPAAPAIGAPPWRIIFRHIVPNCFATYLVLATYYLGFAIIIESSLSFLGVGTPPDQPSWGGMLVRAASAHVKSGPWLAIFPGLAIFLVVMGFNLLGDALRDVFDPRLRGR